MIALAAAMLLTAAGPNPPARAPADPAQRRVCRVQETLGSITPHRVCHTAAEWAQIDVAMARSTDRNLDHMGDHGRTSMSGSGDRIN